MMFTKPCRRPSCTAMLAHAKRYRLNKRHYCSIACASRHRLEREGDNHPLKRRTPEQRHRNAVAGARVRAERQRRAKLLAAEAVVDRFLPADLKTALGARDLARVKVLMARCFLEGRQDHYEAEYTQRRRALIARAS